MSKKNENHFGFEINSFPGQFIPEALVQLDGNSLTLHQLVAVARHNSRITLAAHAVEKVSQARLCVESRLGNGETIYGINTGFGALADVRIPADHLKQLQMNLIRSHACGVGTPLPREVVRAIIVLRLQTMLRGNSGVREATLRQMEFFLNNDIHPVIPSQGSVGACGDLAPLAHLAMALIGEGQVEWQGQVQPSLAVLNSLGREPLSPEAKEGLCLINGTQVMTAIGLLALDTSAHLLCSADITLAMSLDATLGTATAFRAEIQAVRPHAGQQKAAANMRRILADDGLRLSHSQCKKVQDPYSFRCAPQVHGAARNAYDHVLSTLLIEANSSTDNPLVFFETNEILSGGNFHGEPVAMVLDYLAIAIAEIASISERRIDKLVNPHMSGLPAFLMKDSGLNSGFMIPHVVAAALVSENKVHCHPASVDTIPTSAEQEDHVSMGMTSALKLQKVLQNTSRVLAIESLAASQGLEFHLPLQGGLGVRAGYQFVRSYSKALDVDRALADDIECLAAEILSGNFRKSVESFIGELEL
ncbi:histidine ammonia-lyase [bacterium]|nr:histidine ammonia-lyase [bacterium]